MTEFFLSRSLESSPNFLSLLATKHWDLAQTTLQKTHDEKTRQQFWEETLVWMENLSEDQSSAIFSALGVWKEFVNDNMIELMSENYRHLRFRNEVMIWLDDVRQSNPQQLNDKKIQDDVQQALLDFFVDGQSIEYVVRSIGFSIENHLVSALDDLDAILPKIKNIDLGSVMMDLLMHQFKKNEDWSGDDINAFHAPSHFLIGLGRRASSNPRSPILQVFWRALVGAVDKDKIPLSWVAFLEQSQNLSKSYRDFVLSSDIKTPAISDEYARYSSFDPLEEVENIPFVSKYPFDVLVRPPSLILDLFVTSGHIGVIDELLKTSRGQEHFLKIICSPGLDNQPAEYGSVMWNLAQKCACDLSWDYSSNLLWPKFVDFIKKNDWRDCENNNFLHYLCSHLSFEFSPPQNFLLFIKKEICSNFQGWGAAKNKLGLCPHQLLGDPHSSLAKTIQASFDQFILTNATKDMVDEKVSAPKAKM